MVLMKVKNGIKLKIREITDQMLPPKLEQRLLHQYQIQENKKLFIQTQPNQNKPQATNSKEQVLSK